MRPHVSIRGHYDSSGFVPCETQEQARRREVQKAENEIARLEEGLRVWKERLAALLTDEE